MSSGDYSFSNDTDFFVLMYLGKQRGLLAAVTVKDAEESVLEVKLVVGLLVRHAEDVLHVLAAALVAVPGHTQI